MNDYALLLRVPEARRAPRLAPAARRRLTRNEIMLDELLRAEHRLFADVEQPAVGKTLRTLQQIERDLRMEYVRSFRRGGVRMSEWTMAQRQQALGELASMVRGTWHAAGADLGDRLEDMAAASGAAVRQAAIRAYPVDPTLGAPIVPFQYKAVSREALLEIVNTTRAGTSWGTRWRMAGADLVDATIKSVQRSVAGGEGIKDATKRLMQTYRGTLGQRRAELIMRTEMARVNAQATLQFYQSAGRGVVALQYVATLDNRTCMVCGSLDGGVWSNEPGSDRPLYAFPYIPSHPRCRCMASPVAPSARALGWSESQIQGSFLLQQLTGQAPAAVRYPEWLADQDAEFQDRVMGRRRADLFRSGELELTDMVSAFTPSHMARTLGSHWRPTPGV